MALNSMFSHCVQSDITESKNKSYITLNPDCADDIILDTKYVTKTKDFQYDVMLKLVDITSLVGTSWHCIKYMLHVYRQVLRSTSVDS